MRFNPELRLLSRTDVHVSRWIGDPKLPLGVIVCARFPAVDRCLFHGALNMSLITEGHKFMVQKCCVRQNIKNIITPNTRNLFICVTILTFLASQ